MDDTEFVHWEIIFLWGFISVHAILGVNGPGQPLALPPRCGITGAQLCPQGSRLTPVFPLPFQGCWRKAPHLGEKT